MAAPIESAASSSSDEDAEKVEINEEIDFCSPSFNPLKALFSPDVKVPFEDVKSFHSLATYEAALKTKNAKSKTKDKVKASSSKSNKKEPEKGEKSSRHEQITIKDELPTTSKAERKPEERNLQQPPVGKLGSSFSDDVVGIQGELEKFWADNNCDEDKTLQHENDRHNRNVLTRMMHMNGPLGLLSRCVKERLHVRVMTRAAVTVRSICRGFLVAFDKSFNMALIDVDEIYRRPACLGKVRARRYHKLQAAQKTLKREREVQRKLFIASRLQPTEGETPTQKYGGSSCTQFTQIKEPQQTKEVQTEKQSKNLELQKPDLALSKVFDSAESETFSRSVYEGVSVPFSYYEREALMLGISDENVEHRHVNQMFIRGENVVLVSIIDE